MSHQPEVSGRRDGGFVLAVVIFLLFAVGMAAATGYTVVDLAGDMARRGGQDEEALTIAEAGLARFFGEQLGVPSDSVEYAIGSGRASVFARRIATVDQTNGIDLYLVESHGALINQTFNPNSPALKVVAQYAYLHRKSVGRLAAATLSFYDVDVWEWGQIRGNDHSSSASCTESGSEHLPGIVYWGNGTLTNQAWDSIPLPYGQTPPGWGSSGALVGTPAPAVSYGSHQAIYDSLGIRWDVLSDPNFPIEFEGSLPNYASLGSDEYPVVRVDGDLYAGSSWSGRGVLIVTGRITFGTGFYWDGIVLAGDMAFTDRVFWIRGMLVAGLNGNGGYLDFNGYPLIFYDVCSALAASASLSYLEPVDGSWWELR